MWSRPESDEALIERMLPNNLDRSDRAAAWTEWQLRNGRAAVMKFIRLYNNTAEPDEDIWQEALLTAYLEVERGGYQPRPGTPFTAYVKGIARNKIREARRRERRCVPMEDLHQAGSSARRELENLLEARERHEALDRSLEQLPTSRREVLQRFLYGKSTSEIASDLEISETLVRQRKSRGLRSLKQMKPFA